MTVIFFFFILYPPFPLPSISLSLAMSTLRFNCFRSEAWLLFCYLRSKIHFRRRSLVRPAKGLQEINLGAPVTDHSVYIFLVCLFFKYVGVFYCALLSSVLLSICARTFNAYIYHLTHLPDVPGAAHCWRKILYTREKHMMMMNWLGFFLFFCYKRGILANYAFINTDAH